MFTTQNIPFKVNKSTIMSPSQVPNKETPQKPLVLQEFQLRTPKTSIEFTMELRKAINERNMLTATTKSRVFQCLDEIKSNSEMNSKRVKREKALHEIIDSETKYLHQLETIKKFFMKPVQERKLLKPYDHEVLFGNINTIYSLNKELLEELQKGYDNVAQAFWKIAPFLKLYSVHATEFRNTIKILQNARSCNPIFAKFVESQETRPEVQNKLSALLIAPIQRVPRYKLLLNQLYEFTSQDDKDFLLLKDCMIKIDEAAMHINKIIEEHENAQRLLELQRYLRSGEPNIIVPGRNLRKEGVLNKMSPKHKGQKFYVVLMNDILMMNEMKKNDLSVGSLKTNCIFPLIKCKVKEMLVKGCFKVSCQEEELIFYHDHLSEMLNWIKAIEEAIEDHLQDRKTLKKENSNRRPVKRKDIAEYHEVGVSPGQPLKKRKLLGEDFSSVAPSVRGPLASAFVHPFCNSTPIRDATAALKTAQLPAQCLKFSPLKQREIYSETVISTKTNKDLFVFGRKDDEQNVSKLGSFFKSFKSGFKGLFGFKSD